MDEYVGFAGDHLDTWRLLWETALEDVSTGNPTGVLEVLKITDNIHTLESLSGPLGGDIASDLLGGDVTSGLLGGDVTSELLGGDLTSGLLGEGGIGGLLGGGGASPADGKKFSVLMAGEVEASGVGQCQGSLNGDVFTVTCVYAGMTSDVSAVHLDTGKGEFDLEFDGARSGGAAGSFELTAEQVAGVQSGEYTLVVHTESPTGDIRGSIETS